MSFELLFDPLFRLPFINGLLLTGLVAWVGVYLRFRGEWLSALGYAQLSGAGGVFGAAMYWPMMPFAIAAALIAAGTKALLRRSGNDFFAITIVLGYALALIMAANSSQGEMAARAMLDGQLYFTGTGHLIGAGLLLATGSVLLWRLAAPLLRAGFFPDWYSARTVRLIHLAFDFFTVVVIAVAVTAMGVMALFALIFIPAFVAFKLGRCWRSTTIWAVGSALAIYLLSFALAIGLDQPFGPFFALFLLALLPLRIIGRA